MRTTLTLDEDVAKKLRAEAHRSGRSFKETVNEALRRALVAPNKVREAPFRVMARDLGHLRPGISIDAVTSLLEQVEGPLHR